MILGFVSQQYLSLAHIQVLIRDPWAIFDLPSHLLMLWGFSLLLILLRPRGYCMMICPMGRIQELVGSCVFKLSLNKKWVSL